MPLALKGNSHFFAGWLWNILVLRNVTPINGCFDLSNFAGNFSAPEVGKGDCKIAFFGLFSPLCKRQSREQVFATEISPLLFQTSFFIVCHVFLPFISNSQRLETFLLHKSPPNHTGTEIRLKPTWVYLESKGAIRTPFIRASKRAPSCYVCRQAPLSH